MAWSNSHPLRIPDLPPRFPWRLWLSAKGYRCRVRGGACAGRGTHRRRFGRASSNQARPCVADSVLLRLPRRRCRLRRKPPRVPTSRAVPEACAVIRTHHRRLESSFRNLLAKFLERLEQHFDGPFPLHETSLGGFNVPVFCVFFEV